jgi:hypothetical protein
LSPVHNPGCVPDQRYTESADLVVLFEETLDTYLVRRRDGILRQDIPGQRERRCCIVHSVPSTFSADELRRILDDMQHIFGTVFLTELSVNYYANFSQRLDEFLRAMYLPALQDAVAMKN